MKRWIYRILLVLGVVATWLLLRAAGFFEWLTFAHVQHEAADLHVFVDQNPVVSSLVYVAFVTIATALFMPVTALATVLSGYLFDVTLGSLYSVIGVTIGSVLVLLTVRYWLGHSLQRRYGHALKTFNYELHHFGAYYLLVIHIVPMAPGVFINILAGLSTIRVWPFAWATAVGLVPGAIVHALIGKELLHVTSLSELLSWKTMGVLGLLALFALTAILIKRKLHLRTLVEPEQ